MKSNLRLSNRLSSFRFSLASIGPMRSPVSPMTPQSPPQHFRTLATIPDSHSESRPSTSPTVTVTDSENGQNENHTSNSKAPGMKVTMVEPPTPHYTVTNTLLTPRALPSPTPTHIHSPITPWHATFHRNAATIDQETRYLTTTTHLRYTRIILTMLLLALSATVTALTSDILHRYYTTNLSSSFSLQLWPTNTNTTPALLNLTTTTVTLLLALITLFTHLIPTRTAHTTLNTTLFTLLTSLTTLTTLTTLIVSTVTSPLPIFSPFISKTLTALLVTTGPLSTSGLTPNGWGSNPKPETIQSFTCTLSNTAKSFTSSAKTLELPGPADASAMIPSGFPRMCTEAQVGLGLVVVMCVFAGVGMGVAVWNWRVETWIERVRGEREVMSLGTSRGGSSSGSDGKVMEMPAFVEKGDLERGFGRR